MYSVVQFLYWKRQIPTDVENVLYGCGKAKFGEPFLLMLSERINEIIQITSRTT